MVTIKKSSLIAHGALRADLPGKELLTVDNLDMDALLILSRTIATCCVIYAHLRRAVSCALSCRAASCAVALSPDHVRAVSHAGLTRDRPVC